MFLTLSLLSALWKLQLLLVLAQFVLGDGTFTLKISDCKEHEPRVRAAVQSMQLAAFVAEARTRKLLDVLNRNPGPAEVVKGSDISALMLTESMYGKADLCNMAIKVADLQERIELFRQALNNPYYYVNIVCGEGFLEQTEHDPDHEVFDTRPQEWGGQMHYYFDNKEDLWECNHSGVTAWSQGQSQLLPNLVDLTVLCDQLFMPSNLNPYNAIPYRELRETEFPPGSVDLEFIDNSNIATVLTHEFSHSQNIYDCGGETDDNFTVDKETGDREQCYGWYCVTKLAQEAPEWAISNADTFAMYLLGLTLDKNDWSTGQSRPVPPNILGPISSLVWKDGRWERPGPPQADRSIPLPVVFGPPVPT